VEENGGGNDKMTLKTEKIRGEMGGGERENEDPEMTDNGFENTHIFASWRA
jgi:hypothetical protein